MYRNENKKRIHLVTPKRKSNKWPAYRLHVPRFLKEEVTTLAEVTPTAEEVSGPRHITSISQEINRNADLKKVVS